MRDGLLVVCVLFEVWCLCVACWCFCLLITWVWRLVFVLIWGVWIIAAMFTDLLLVCDCAVLVVLC